MTDGGIGYRLGGRQLPCQLAIGPLGFGQLDANSVQFRHDGRWGGGQCALLGVGRIGLLGGFGGLGLLGLRSVGLDLLLELHSQPIPLLFERCDPLPQQAGVSGQLTALGVLPGSLLAVPFGQLLGPGQAGQRGPTGLPGLDNIGLRSCAKVLQRRPGLVGLLGGQRQLPAETRLGLRMTALLDRAEIRLVLEVGLEGIHFGSEDGTCVARRRGGEGQGILRLRR